MSVNYALAAAVILGATAAIWKGSDWLETSSGYLSRYYGLPMVVQGAIVTAVGSSFPELASVVFAGLAGSLELGVGAIVGSAIFNVLVIPGVAGVATETPVKSSRTLVYKEAQFYMLAVSVLLITFALAVIYYPVAGERLQGEVTRPLALIPLALYGLYIFIQYQDTSDHDAELARDGIDIRRQWAYLLVSLAVILVAVEQLVHQVEAIGVELGVSQFLLGVTIIAAATSLPDTLVSVRAARANRGVVSMANVLGSNTFDLLVAIPVGIMLVGTTAIDFAMAVPMFGALTGATILLFTLLRTDMVLTRTESYVLVVAYFVFVVWVLAEVAGVVTGILPT
ncbi:sodium:calcium antiporter [Salinibaculum salinum]|uniref:sodium:calcium antiporter n=1 Tax=Salinibaculum salinum TaxID=3131996 RepID=UPI0030EC5AFC